MVDVDVYAGRVRVVFDAHRERYLTINRAPLCPHLHCMRPARVPRVNPFRNFRCSPADRLASCACTRGIRRTAPHTAQALPRFA